MRYVKFMLILCLLCNLVNAENIVSYPGATYYINTTDFDTLGHSLYMMNYGLNNKAGALTTIGNYSCNLQFSRLSTSQGPLAPHSGILGGQNNAITVDGNYSVILGGIGSIIKGYASAILSGYENKINNSAGDFSYIIGGVHNYISSQKNSILHGDSVYITGNNNIVIGSNDTISGSRNFIVGSNITATFDSTYFTTYKYNVIGNGSVFLKIVKVGSFGAIIFSPADTFYFKKDSL